MRHEASLRDLDSKHKGREVEPCVPRPFPKFFLKADGKISLLIKYEEF